MYLYRVMWNLPGCLPEMEPVYFDNAVDAFDFLGDEFAEYAGMHSPDEVAQEWSRLSYECEMKCNAGVIGEADWSAIGPNSYVYSISCEDVEESEAKAILAGDSGMAEPKWSGGYNTDYSGAFPNDGE